MTLEDAIKTAHDLGAQHAEAAASWVADGNTTRAHAAFVLAMMADGDPAVENYLPTAPNLSGEWADDLTPDSLLREIDADEWGDDENATDAIASAYEDGASETFYVACERELLKHNGQGA